MSEKSKRTRSSRLRRRRVLGHAVREFLPPDLAEQRMAAIERAVDTGRQPPFHHDLAVGRLEEELGPLFENVPDLIATLAPDGTVLFINGASPDVSPEQPIPKTIYQYFPPGEHQKIRAAIERALVTGQSGSFDTVATSRRGGQGFYSCRVGAVKRRGRIVGLTLVATDVTEREHALDALRESEERYRGLVEGSHDAIFINTPDGRVVHCNQAALDLLGYTRDELSHLNVTSLYVHRADRDRFRAELERAGAVRDYEIKLRRKDRTELDGLLTSTVRRAKDGTVIGYQGSLRDVTERKRLEREMLEFSEREQRRIGQDLHDGLGQHLTGIAFLSKVLTQKLAAKGLPEATEATKIETLITEAISQARSLAKGLQPVALGTGGLALALEEMCLNMTQLFEIPCNCRLAGELSLDDSNVATNVYHIAREAVNNAVKHSGAGNIRLELHTVPGVATLLVHDDGVGIRPARGKPPGLGLQIMHYRAAMIGASLEIQRDQRGGTIVRCVFPLPGTRSEGRS